MTPKTYDDGLRNGKTEATLEGIAKSLDVIWKKLGGLPCTHIQNRVSSLEKGQHIILWALGSTATAIGSLLTWLLVRGA